MPVTDSIKALSDRDLQWEDVSSHLIEEANELVSRNSLRDSYNAAYVG